MMRLWILHVEQIGRRLHVEGLNHKKKKRESEEGREDE